MADNEKERPVVSGLDQIFGAGENNADKEPKRDPSTSDPHSDERAEGQSNNRDKNRRRSRRRGRGPKDDNAETTAANVAEPLPHAAYENDDEMIDIDPDDMGAGGFGDPKTYTELVMTTASPECVDVVGIRFKDTGKTYYFDPKDNVFKKGDHVVVETSRGLEYGSVSVANTGVPVSTIVPPLRPVVRAASDADDARFAENTKKEKEAFKVCLEKIREHGLEMKLIDAEYTFDQSKLTFYFSADGRVDFRELVKDLAGVFRTRIELRQIGIRDEAKLVGGLGVCGRPFCCSTFLSDFVQVSIKMAKEQNLSLNSAKISGSCGRLMCCLRYEHDTYAEEIKKTPSVGSRVRTDDGVGVVTETAPLRGKIKVRLGDETNQTVREFDRDAVTVIPKNKPDNKQNSTANDAGASK